ncbi:MAG: hypothetical protein BWY63_00329 [Chloroflexi bacterium ADurb.Bin360]|nr:MAG: hypothetical protein BWY63_00329 [Chloroflexi bacterium ADurb.Bin360]
MANRKLGIGACFAVLGALGIALGPAMGLTNLAYPWSFLAGFVTGILAGLGVTLGEFHRASAACSTYGV